MLTLSPFTNLAELMVSSPSPKLIVNNPPIIVPKTVPGSRGKFKLKVSAKPLPVIVQLFVLLYIAEKPGCDEPTLPPKYM